VLERLSVGLELRAIKVPIGLEAAGDVPSLAAGKLDETGRSVATVELKHYTPPLGQQGEQIDQHLTGNPIFASEMNSPVLGALTIQLAHHLLAQVELQIDRGGVIADSHCTDHVAEGVLEAGLGACALAVIVNPGPRFDMARALVFLA